MTAYYACSICLSGKRYVYGQATFTNQGKVLDFADASANLGQQDAQLKNDCAAVLKNGTDDQKKQCRGDMNSDCAKKLDNACQQTGLYDILINNPIPKSALPTQCDETLIGYSDSTCFQWLAPKIVKATIVFDYKGFLDLPRAIANSLNAASLRYLEDTATIKVVETSKDPAAKDPTAIIPTNIASVAELSVDSTTTTSTPSISTYTSTLTQTASNLNLTTNSSFLQCSFSLVILSLVALLV